MIKEVNEVGITETYDPCFDFSWVDNLRPVNIIITKQLTDKLIDTLTSDECKNRCVLHLTVTGLGGSIYEPNVPDYKWSRRQYDKLILEKGFDYNRVILRVDPIIPTNGGLYLASLVFKEFENTPVTKVRVSSLDMYSHVISRLTSIGKEAPYTSFCAPDDMLSNLDDLLSKWSTRYDFLSCAEPKLKVPRKVGCVSQEDIDLVNNNITLIGHSRQRGDCLCPSNKVNIIKRKPGRCPHKCIYCYWRNDS